MSKYRIYDHASQARPDWYPVSCPGNGIKTLYKGQLDKDGEVQVVEAGTHDLYAEIQSYAASCDMQQIVSRYMQGDVSVLSRVQGMYADVTEFPSTPHEALDLMRQTEAIFDKLPKEVKEHYGQDVNRFIADFGSPDWYSLLEMTKPEAVVEEVKSDES